MRLRVTTEPQLGADYDTIARFARAVEAAGFDGLFRSDHYLPNHGPGLAGPGGTDAWVTLAGLARETTRLRLGTLVSAATFRHPGPLAVTVAQVDAMSGGRIELGLGAGWFEREHRAMGIPFPPAGERMDRLEELLEVLTAWWGVPTGSTFDHHGRHFHLEANPGLPRPVGGRVPLILGGWGPRRTPALAARFADEFNVAFGTTDDAAAQFARVRAAAESVGRDPAGLRYSQVLTVVCAPRRAEAERRAAAAGWDPARLATLPGRFIGSPEALLDRLGAVAGTGADTVYLQLLDLTDHDHVALIGESVAPVLRAAV